MVSILKLITAYLNVNAIQVTAKTEVSHICVLYMYHSLLLSDLSKNAIHIQVAFFKTSFVFSNLDE